MDANLTPIRLKNGDVKSGVSVDVLAAGKIWAGCYDFNVAVRVDPNEGDEVVIGGVTNHVGGVDMVVGLGG